VRFGRFTLLGLHVRHLGNCKSPFTSFATTTEFI